MKLNRGCHIKATFNKKALFTTKLGLNLRKNIISATF